MCGYVGFLDGSFDVTKAKETKAKENEAKRNIEKMSNLISHRGPDDEAYYVESPYAVGFRRLSIIDLAGGVQPMTNEDDHLVLVFNGEIYNYKDIRDELQEAGHIFKTQSDTEVLLHAYEEFGEKMFHRIRGMFSFVIYDRKKRELFGARDFFGIKPLYYANFGDTFLFGSEIKGLMAHPAFKKELNERALESYLSFQYSHGSETFFKNVYKMMPGHWFRYSNDMESPEIGRYWTPEFHSEEGNTLEYWSDEIENVFDDSVAAHKISDVEVGALLSGGVDSSYIACSADVDKTFTVGFETGSKYNETDAARALSEKIQVKNISKMIQPDEFWDEFPNVQWHMDEPLADPSAVALYFVCKNASEHLKVILSGDGADEIFGGYNIYNEPYSAPLYNKIPFPIRKVIGKIAGIFPAKRGLNFLVRKGKKLEERFIGNAYIFTENERKRILNIKTDAPSPASVVKPYFDRVQDKDDATKMQFVDINTWLAGDILLKADKMSMAHSIELRVPFLDRNVMDIASHIPRRYRINGKDTKCAMRHAASRRMHSNWSSKKKLGFPVPTRVWLKEEKYINMIRESFTSKVSTKYFNTNRLLKLLDDHIADKADNSRKIWTVYSFLIWHEVFFADQTAA
ncbi:MAG: asparagine synthase (glutamine-hydrolyzing) [Clostridiales Family XIII bacterium]|nr:asparagine synthase (glutamine-hydrolyzing) [Clostridiales Family XIII bacterium]